MLKTYIAAKTFAYDLKDRFFKDESGASLVEYSILIGIITVAAITAIGGVGTYVSGRWTALDAALP
jgi:pilus assembly protein Flp/PilA